MLLISFFFLLLFACSVGLFFASFIYRIYKKISRNINFPNRIKPKKVIYIVPLMVLMFLSKDAKKYLFKKFKRIDSYIAFHTRILNRLKAERVSTSDSRNQNSETSSL